MSFRSLSINWGIREVTIWGRFRATDLRSSCHLRYNSTALGEGPPPVAVPGNFSSSFLICSVNRSNFRMAADTGGIQSPPILSKPRSRFATSLV